MGRGAGLHRHRNLDDPASLSVEPNQVRFAPDPRTLGSRKRNPVREPQPRLRISLVGARGEEPVGADDEQAAVHRG
jgi:hypothetical protein